MSDESRNENVTGGPAPDKDSNLGDLGDVAHPFDQTNGLIDGLAGDADGMADPADADAAERGTDDYGDTDDGTDDGAGDGTVVPPVLPAGR